MLRAAQTVVGFHNVQAILYPGTLVPPTTATQILVCLCVGALGYGAQVWLHCFLHAMSMRACYWHTSGDRWPVLTPVCMLQITLTHGLRSAKAAPAIATSYLSVVWGILGSLFIFHEVPTVLCFASSRT
jgi:uncharacterized membrane protein